MGLSERLNRLATMLGRAGYDGYISGARPDVRYFTGSADTSGVLLYRLDEPPVLLTRPGAAAQARDTATAEVETYGPDQSIEERLAELVKRLGPRNVAVEGLDGGFIEVLRHLDDLRVHLAPGISRAIRRRKEPEEIALLRQAAAIADAAMAAAMAVIRVGATELAAAAALESDARLRGCEGPLAPAQVKGGLRAAYPDATASSRPFEAGDLGFVDLGIYYQGYLGDMTRAFVIGELSRERRRILETVDRVQRMARAMVRPGVACREIDLAVRRAFDEAGFPGNPPHHTGHAMGLGNDAPRLTPDSNDVLAVGDMVTIEPGIYVPGVGGARIEDVLLVGEDGVEILSQHPRVTEIPV